MLMRMGFKFLLLGITVIMAACGALGQVVQVDSSGNLTAAGTVTAAGFATTGSGTAFLGGNLGSQPPDASCTTTGKGCIWLDSSGVVKQKLNNGTVLTLGTLSTVQFWITNGSSDWTGTNTLGFPSANQMRITGIQLDKNMTAATTKVSYLIGSGDNSGTDHYDIGIYGPCSSGQANCPLVVHLGSAIAGISGTALGASAGTQYTTNWNSTSGNALAAGRYYIAMTTDCSTSCATLYSNASSGAFTYFSNANYGGGTTSGVLPATITAPTDSVTISKIPDLAIF